MKRVVVIGGGVTGLACAHALGERAEVILLEAAPRLGGLVATERVGEFLVEGGPDSLFAARPEVAEACRELGLDWVPAAQGGTSVCRGGRLHALPAGLASGVPTRMASFLRSGLVSWAGKLRMGLDLVLPRGPSGGDISLGAFLRRRLGHEALERIGEPVLAGIHLARADELSLQSTFPHLLELEREHRSLILGLRRAGRRGPAQPMMAPSGGMGQLVERLRSASKWVDIRTSSPVRRLHAVLTRPLGRRWRVEARGELLDADAVVLATPAPVSAELVRPDFPELADALDSIRYRSSATVSFGFRGEPPVAGTGMLVPASEGRLLAACTVSSRKLPGRAPDGAWLIRCFLRDAPHGAKEAAFEDLQALVGPLPEPEIAREFLWPSSRPVYEVGHAARVAEIERRTPPGVLLAGSAYRGAGIPDCLREGRRTAARLLART